MTIEILDTELEVDIKEYPVQDTFNEDDMSVAHDEEE